MDGCRHDEADAQTHRRQHHAERTVLLLDDFAPQVVRGEFANQHKAQPKDGHAHQRVQDGAKKCGVGGVKDVTIDGLHAVL